MVHTEEGTKGNLHSGHMVYTPAFVEVGAGAGGMHGGSASQGHPRLFQAGWGGPLRRWAHVHSDGHLATPGRRGRPLRGNTGPLQLEDADL